MVREYSDCEKLKFEKPSNGRSISVLRERRKNEIRTKLRLMQDSFDIVSADIALYCGKDVSMPRNQWHNRTNRSVFTWHEPR